jgi:hypothetical protein
VRMKSHGDVRVDCTMAYWLIRCYRTGQRAAQKLATLEGSDERR